MGVARTDWKIDSFTYGLKFDVCRTGTLARRGIDGQECPSYAKPFDSIPNARNRIYRLVLGRIGNPSYFFCNYRFDSAMQVMPIARQVARTLAERKLRVVFAESCTAGLVSASLSRIPGISQWHCGSAVTYRDDSKIQWLKVHAADILRETAVSETVARQMARGVLTNTPEAHVSASVTGHLGPDAPADLDGVIYVAIARRRGPRMSVVHEARLKLTSSTRHQRQREAVAQVFRCLLDSIE